jgi:hypothetical protein
LSAVSLGIGGVVVSVGGLDARLAAAARRRYASFLATGDSVLHIEVRAAVDAKHDPDADPHVTRTAARAFAIRYGALEAEIDLASGRATARVPATIYVLDSLLRIAMTLILVEHDGLLLHAAGVLVGDAAHVYFGPSGVGKTTVARSVPRADVFSDEIVALFAAPDGAVRVAGTPFHGDLNATSPRVANAAALVRLHQADEDSLSMLGAAAATSALLGSTLFFSNDDEHAERLLGLAARVCGGRTYALAFQRHTHVPSFVAKHLDPAFLADLPAREAHPR